MSLALAAKRRLIQINKTPTRVIDNCIYALYILLMIKNFRHKGLRQLFEKGDRSKVSARDVQQLSDILAALTMAKTPGDMSLPGFRLHPLKGDLKGFWAVTVRANWRVIFRFEDGHAADVDLTDYH